MRQPPRERGSPRLQALVVQRSLEGEGVFSPAGMVVQGSPLGSEEQGGQAPSLRAKPGGSSGDLRSGGQASAHWVEHVGSGGDVRSGGQAAGLLLTQGHWQ